MATMAPVSGAAYGIRFENPGGRLAIDRIFTRFQIGFDLVLRVALYSPFKFFPSELSGFS